MKIRLFAALLPCMYVALAQAQTPAPRPDPADPDARVPAQPYRSPFAGYQALGATEVGDWRAANDEVGRIGGWRAYAREAQAPAPATQSEAEAAPRGPGDHGQHGHPGMPGGKP